MHLAIDISLKEFGIPKLLNPDDFLEFPDLLTNITYLSYFKTKVIISSLRNVKAFQKQEIDSNLKRMKMIETAIEARKIQNKSNFMDLGKSRKSALANSRNLSEAEPEVSITVVEPLPNSRVCVSPRVCYLPKILLVTVIGGEST